MLWRDENNDWFPLFDCFVGRLTLGPFSFLPLYPDGHGLSYVDTQSGMPQRSLESRVLWTLMEVDKGMSFVLFPISVLIIVPSSTA